MLRSFGRQIALLLAVAIGLVTLNVIDYVLRPIDVEVEQPEDFTSWDRNA